MFLLVLEGLLRLDKIHKMRKIKFIVLVIFFANISFSCKKYPDGGISINVKKKIIGIWGVEYLSVDGIDSTANIKSNPNYCENTIIFIDTRDRDERSLFVGTHCSGGTNANGGEWYVGSRGKTLGLFFEDAPTKGELYPVLLNADINIGWDIRRLKKEQMWLKTNLNNKEYFIKFNKKPI